MIGSFAAPPIRVKSAIEYGWVKSAIEYDYVRVTLSLD